MSTPQIPIYTGEIPNRAVDTPTEFSDNADETMNYFLPLAENYNVVAEFVNSAASTAQAAANFQGYWSSLTGAYAAGIGVRHSEFNWLLLVTTSDITSTEPDELNSDWLQLSSFADIDNTLNRVYPVGSVMLSVNAVNPSTYLNFGVWSRIAEGKFLSGVGTGADENGVNKTLNSGDNPGEWQHTQTTNELGSHSHTFSGTSSSNGAHNHSLSTNVSSNTSSNVLSSSDGSSASNTQYTGINGNHSHTYSGTTSSKGSSSAMNVTNPSFGVYIWERVS